MPDISNESLEQFLNTIERLPEPEVSDFGQEAAKEREKLFQEKLKKTVIYFDNTPEQKIHYL